MTDKRGTEPQIVVSGTTWMGHGIDSIESEMERMFSNARREIQVVTFSISTRAPELFKMIKLALKNGVIIKMIVNNFDHLHHNIREKLLEMKKSEGFLLYKYVPKKGDDEDALHAKIIVADRNIAILGSANLSWRGLVSNHEIGVVLHDRTASDVANLVDLLIEKNIQVKQIGIKGNEL